MKIWSILIYGLLSGPALCGSFKWDPIVLKSYADSGAGIKAESTSDGVLHIIGQQYNTTFKGFTYHKLYPNGTLTQSFISLSPNNHPHPSLSFQVSRDGRQILLAYEGRRNGSSTKPQYITEVFFIESADGGTSWSQPVKMVREDMEDSVYRSKPWLLLEKDTGRVYVGYIYANMHGTIRDNHVMLSIREPGKKTFEAEFIIPGNFCPHSTSLGYTVDKETGKRYLHMFWTVQHEGMHYTHSTDNGKTWRKSILIGHGSSIKTPPPAAINVDASPCFIYTQHGAHDLMVAWSSNHGLSMQNQIKVYSGSAHRNSLTMCGDEGRGIVVTVDVKHSGAAGYVGFMQVGSKRFVSLPYPFAKMDLYSTTYPEVACAHLGNNQYSIVFVVENYRRKFTYLVHGTLKVSQ